MQLYVVSNNVVGKYYAGMKDVQGISKVYQVKAEDGVITSGDWEYKYIIRTMMRLKL